MVYPYPSKTYHRGSGQEVLMYDFTGYLSVASVSPVIDLPPGHYWLSYSMGATNPGNIITVKANAFINATQSQTQTGTDMQFFTHGTNAGTSVFTLAASATGYKTSLGSIQIIDGASGVTTPVALPYGFRMEITNTATSVGSWALRIVATEAS